ncbi:hypothetical protein A3K42_00855 [candidate division WWE3 bacterium RBG_13_37_7]|uniref:Glycosyltransferase 2-like domain-containing protein n=1 Tax=candidate division WWE3 bacterium RBG_13_37_7 TaxID=1802609 RepID=A0A1F4U1L9_UNCKA|nr:MAG: hypothetical protein A3K42_00855 [candidate division WWE3 bacterium RBG_13_37_7]
MNKNFTKRFFEISLGATTWVLLTSPVWLGLLYPPAIVYLLAFFTVYWFYLAIKHFVGLVVGYQRYAKEIKVDWWEQCKKLNFVDLPDKTTLPPSLADVKHFLLIPVVNEPEEVLRGSIDSIFNQSFPTKQVVLVYTMEERFSKEMTARLEKLIRPYESKFHKFMHFVHPAGIEGEAVGVAGANRTWGAKHAIKELEKSGENLRNYIFDTIDSDHVMHKHYLSRVTHIYLTSDRRDCHYYSTAVHLFNNNLWEVPTVMRIEANAITLGTLSGWGWSVEHPTEASFSAYSASLQTLIDANYWDVELGIDDTIFYWRALFARNGDFDGKPHFIPYSADAVQGSTYWGSYKSLYKQLLRWGWGAIDFPLSMQEFLENRKIPLRKKIAWFLKLIERRIILINIVFLITFGFNIVTLVNPLVKQTTFAYSLPNLMSTILTVTLIFLVPSTYYRFRFTDPIPRKWPIYRKALAYLEGPMIIFNMLTFSFFPFIEAQTRLMFGKRMKNLYHTPKVRA